MGVKITFFGLWYLHQEIPGVPNPLGPSVAGGALMTGVGGTIKSKSKSVENRAIIFLFSRLMAKNGMGIPFFTLLFSSRCRVFTYTFFKLCLKNGAIVAAVFSTPMNSVSEHNRGEFSWPLIWVLFSWCSFIVTVNKSPSIVQHMTTRKTILV